MFSSAHIWKFISNVYKFFWLCQSNFGNYILVLEVETCLCFNLLVQGHSRKLIISIVLLITPLKLVLFRFLFLQIRSIYLLSICIIWILKQFWKIFAGWYIQKSIPSFWLIEYFQCIFIYLVNKWTEMVNFFYELFGTFRPEYKMEIYKENFL